MKNYLKTKEELSYVILILFMLFVSLASTLNGCKNKDKEEGSNKAKTEQQENIKFSNNEKNYQNISL